MISPNSDLRIALTDENCEPYKLSADKQNVFVQYCDMIWEDAMADIH